MEKSSKDIIKRTRPCKTIETDNENRGVEQPSSVVLSRQISLEETINNEEVNVAGRLSPFLPKGREITSDPIILQAITSSKLPLVCRPFSQSSASCIRLSNLEERACAQEVSRLLNKQVIEVVEDCKDQFLSSFFVIKNRQEDGDLFSI